VDLVNRELPMGNENVKISTEVESPGNPESVMNAGVENSELLVPKGIVNGKLLEGIGNGELSRLTF
jgi:hypothetical protein